MHERFYFKAVAPIFATEPAITAELELRSGGATPSVIAVDHERGWILTDDLGDTEVSTEAHTRGAIDLLVSLQRRLVDHRAELERAGCRHRPLGVLADAVAAALDAPVTKAVVAVDAATRARIVDGVADAVATVETWRISETFVHGDFHPGNVAATDRGLVIFDWSDACFTSPLVDAVTWAWWYTEDSVRTEFVWSCFESAWRRELGLDPAAFDRRAAQAIAAAFHLTSYVEICEALEPASRVDHVEGLTHFVGTSSARVHDGNVGQRRHAQFFSQDTGDRGLRRGLRVVLSGTHIGVRQARSDPLSAHRDQRIMRTR